jgi:hypothetical protein
MGGDLKAESTKLLSFDPEWNFSSVDLNRATAGILPHSGHKHNILNIHLFGFRQGERCRPFAQRRHRRNYPMID